MALHPIHINTGSFRYTLGTFFHLEIPSTLGIRQNPVRRPVRQHCPYQMLDDPNLRQMSDDLNPRLGPRTIEEQRLVSQG